MTCVVVDRVRAIQGDVTGGAIGCTQHHGRWRPVRCGVEVGGGAFATDACTGLDPMQRRSNSGCERAWRWPRTVPSMGSDSADGAPDGSTNISDSERQRTDELADGSPTGNATEDPNQDSDTNSGGEPTPPKKDAS